MTAPNLPFPSSENPSARTPLVIVSDFNGTLEHHGTVNEEWALLLAERAAKGDRCMIATGGPDTPDAMKLILKQTLSDEQIGRLTFHRKETLSVELGQDGAEGEMIVPDIVMDDAPTIDYLPKFKEHIQVMHPGIGLFFPVRFDAVAKKLQLTDFAKISASLDGVALVTDRGAAPLPPTA